MGHTNADMPFANLAKATNARCANSPQDGSAYKAAPVRLQPTAKQRSRVIAMHLLDDPIFKFIQYYLYIDALILFNSN